MLIYLSTSLPGFEVVLQHKDKEDVLELLEDLQVAWRGGRCLVSNPEG